MFCILHLLDIEGFEFFFYYCLDAAYICKNYFSVPEKAF